MTASPLNPARQGNGPPTPASQGLRAPTPRPFQGGDKIVGKIRFFRYENYCLTIFRQNAKMTQKDDIYVVQAGNREFLLHPR